MAKVCRKTVIHSQIFDSHSLDDEGVPSATGHLIAKSPLAIMRKPGSCGHQLVTDLTGIAGDIITIASRSQTTDHISPKGV